MTQSNIIEAGYKVFYFNSYADVEPKILHEPYNFKSNKLSSGKINQAQNEADEFTFTISSQNTYYQKLEAINGIVKVINLFDNSIEFLGRILEISGQMSSGGLFYQEIVCESELGYLNDMTQSFSQRVNKGPCEHLKYIIEFHNARVPKHKQFKIGTFNVTNRSDAPYLYTTYETTWEAIKNRIVDKYGGYIVLRREADGNYIDYLEEVGEHKTSPIQLGKNIKSATRAISLGDMMTQIVPIGGDLEDFEVTDNSSGAIREQVNIGSVNGGRLYLEDTDLVKEFGIIRKIVTWSDITDSTILKKRGQQYLDNQKVALASWQISVIDRSLIDNKFEKFVLNNYHPIINAPLSGIEELQIIEKEIDILNPQSVDLTIGADSLTITSFQLQQQQAQASMEKVLAENEAKRLASEAAAALTNQITLLTSELSNYQAISDSYAVEITTLEAQINELDAEEDAALIKTLKTQIATATSKKESYDAKIIEITEQLNELKGDG